MKDSSGTDYVLVNNHTLARYNLGAAGEPIDTIEGLNCVGASVDNSGHGIIDAYVSNLNSPAVAKLPKEIEGVPVAVQQGGPFYLY